MLRIARLLSFFVFTSLSSIQASTMMSVDERELSSASWIGLVKISSFEKVSDNRPVTLVKARVLDVIKGVTHQGDEIYFELPGGKIGSREISILGFGAKSFKKERDYFVFLDRDPASLRASLNGAGAQLVNWTAYSVEQSLSGRKFVRPVGSLTRASKSGGKMSLTHDQGRSRDYESFVTEIYRNMN